MNIILKKVKMNEKIPELINYVIVDVTKIITDKKYDCSVSIEVAEHIPEEYSEKLVEHDQLSNGFIIFTAAPPGQGGTGHIN